MGKSIIILLPLLFVSVCSSNSMLIDKNGERSNNMQRPVVHTASHWRYVPLNSLTLGDMFKDSSQTKPEKENDIDNKTSSTELLQEKAEQEDQDSKSTKAKPTIPGQKWFSFLSDKSPIATFGIGSGNGSNGSALEKVKSGFINRLGPGQLHKTGVYRPKPAKLSVLFSKLRKPYTTAKPINKPTTSAMEDEDASIEGTENDMTDNEDMNKIIDTNTSLEEEVAISEDLATTGATTTATSTTVSTPVSVDKPLNKLPGWYVNGYTAASKKNNDNDNESGKMETSLTIRPTPEDIEENDGPNIITADNLTKISFPTFLKEIYASPQQIKSSQKFMKPKVTRPTVALKPKPSHSMSTMRSTTTSTTTSKENLKAVSYSNNKLSHRNSLAPIFRGNDNNNNNNIKNSISNNKPNRERFREHVANLISLERRLLSSLQTQTRLQKDVVETLNKISKDL